ncbi:hypothetical protein CLOM_g5741 [Closterium sp. NIES-68]|nr:hypothetical protein CLOM_g5741 [Closterium sp. NIES-68]GJP73789.1 hypothetical protein CLOP_g4472 [Closterium sp. NIES-67]
MPAPCIKRSRRGISPPRNLAFPIQFLPAFLLVLVVPAIPDIRPRPFTHPATTRLLPLTLVQARDVHIGHNQDSKSDLKSHTSHSRHSGKHAFHVDPSVPSVYKEGDEVVFECRHSPSDPWGPGPLCFESGRPLSVFVGVNIYRYCSLEVRTAEAYERLAQLVQQELTWQCRVAADPRNQSYVPLTFLLMGSYHRLKDRSSSSSGSSSNNTSDHSSSSRFGASGTLALGTGSHVKDILRVNNRLNLVFHAFKNRIIGAAVYPVADHLQLVKQGGLVGLHGSVVWFHHHSFQTESSVGVGKGGESDWWSVSGGGGSWSREVGIAMASGFLCSLFTLVIAVVVYQGQLKPAIIRKCLKKE